MTVDPSRDPETGSLSSDLAGQMAERRSLVATLRARGINPYANDARVTHAIEALPASDPSEVPGLPLDSEVAPGHTRYAVAGRLLQINEMGKAKFLFIRGDRGAMLQLYLRAEHAEAFKASQSLQLGDFVWARGPLFRTRKQKRALLVEDVAAAVGRPVQEVTDLLRFAEQPASLDAPLDPRVVRRLEV